mgnify:CR=1 FL=1
MSPKSSKPTKPKSKSTKPKSTKPKSTKPKSKSTNQKDIPGTTLYNVLKELTKNKKWASDKHRIKFRVHLDEAISNFPGWFHGRANEISPHDDDIQMLKETVAEALQNKPRPMMKCGLAPFDNSIRRQKL